MKADLPYRYAWDRCGRKGQPCQVTARGKMNSVCVVFADGFSMVTSGNALRKRAKPAIDDSQGETACKATPST